MFIWKMKIKNDIMMTPKGIVSTFDSMRAEAHPMHGNKATKSNLQGDIDI